MTHGQTRACLCTHTKNISIDSCDCLSGWVLYSLLTRRDVISRDCWGCCGTHTPTHTALRARKREPINMFLIRQGLQACSPPSSPKKAKKKNKKSTCETFCVMNTCDDTNTDSHSSNQISQAGEVLTRFYGQVDAVPSISGLSPPPSSPPLCLYLPSDERFGRSGGRCGDGCFLLKHICRNVCAHRWECVPCLWLEYKDQSRIAREPTSACACARVCALREIWSGWTEGRERKRHKWRINILESC